MRTRPTAFLTALALAPALALSGPAIADTTLAARAAAAHQAADQLLAIGSTADQSSWPLRQSIPTVAPLLDAVLDTEAMPADPPLSDFPAISDWGQSIARVGKLYLLAGTGADQLAAAGDPKIAAQIEQNLSTYAAEFGRYADAEMTIERVMTRTTIKLIAADPSVLSDPVKADGLRQVRDGIAQSISGILIEEIPAAGFPVEWRRARMPALLAIAPDAAKLLNADSSGALGAQARSLADANPDPALKADLDRFADLVSGSKPAS